MQIYRSVCDECEDIVEAGVAVGGLADGIPRKLFECECCGEERTVFCHPEEDAECAAYYSKKHPAAVAEVKAVVAQLDAGVDAADVELIGRAQAAGVTPKQLAAVDAGGLPECDECGRPSAAGLKHREVVGGRWLCSRCFDRAMESRATP